jgi:hypothetical protein
VVSPVQRIQPWYKAQRTRARRVLGAARRRARAGTAKIASRFSADTQNVDQQAGHEFLIDGARTLYEHGVFDITKNVDDWALFARHSPPGHYYSPIPSYRRVMSRADRIFDRWPNELPGIDLNEGGQEKWFLEVADVLRDEQLPALPTDGWRYCGANGFFGMADALVLHGMLRWLQPRRIIEIGSGWSSALILDTVDRYLSGSEQLCFIEPHPERLNDLLKDSDRSRVTVHVSDVQTVDPALFDTLEDGDVLFIDSSHVVTIGSDVPYLVGEIVPSLKPGVVVHVHDTFWPFELPRQWFDEGRLWAEPYMWRAFLTHNSAWEVLFFNHWFVNARRAIVERHLPRMLESGTGSLWLRRR